MPKRFALFLSEGENVRTAGRHRRHNKMKNGKCKVKNDKSKCKKGWLFILGFGLSFCIFIFTFYISGCGRAKKEDVIVAGSTTVLPIVQAASEEYKKEEPAVNVVVQGGGSSAGIEAVSTGTADIGTSSRELKGSEGKRGLVGHVVAVDAIAVIINPSNKVDNLMQTQLKGIFSGKITSWKEVGGADIPIILINRDEASGTREAFRKKVMGASDFTKEAVIQPGSGQVRSIVASTPGAIGYISFGYVTSQVKVVKYDGVRLTKEAVKAGKYALQRKLHLFTKGKPSGATKAFIDFILSSRIQKEIVGVEFIPVK